MNVNIPAIDVGATVGQQYECLAEDIAAEIRVQLRRENKTRIAQLYGLFLAMARDFGDCANPVQQAGVVYSWRVAFENTVLGWDADTYADRRPL